MDQVSSQLRLFLAFNWTEEITSLTLTAHNKTEDQRLIQLTTLADI